MFLLAIFVITFLISSAVSVEVKCEFKEVKIKGHENPLYTCIVDGKETLETSQYDNYITDVSGAHMDGRSNKDVKQFIALSQAIEYFPGGLPSHFPGLESINIKNSSLKYLYKNDLNGLSSLWHFAVAGNEIELLPPKLFEDNPKLEELHFENNQIRNISADLLDCLANPKVVHFYGNPCITTDHKGDIDEIKKDLKEKCPLDAEEIDDLDSSVTEKLRSQLMTMEDAFKSLKESMKKSETDPSSDDDQGKIKSLQTQLDALKQRSEYLLIKEAVTNGTLEQYAEEILNLTEENQSFKLSNENLIANLTETLDNLKKTQQENAACGEDVSRLKKELSDEKVRTALLKELIDPRVEQIIKLRAANDDLSEKLDAAKKDHKKELNKLHEELLKLIKDHEINQSKYADDVRKLLKSNKEIKKAYTMVIANLGKCDNLIEKDRKRRKT